LTPVALGPSHLSKLKLFARIQELMAQLETGSIASPAAGEGEKARPHGGCAKGGGCSCSRPQRAGGVAGRFTFERGALEASICRRADGTVPRDEALTTKPSRLAFRAGG
jgi:hypothetical protein